MFIGNCKLQRDNDKVFFCLIVLITQQINWWNEQFSNQIKTVNKLDVMLLFEHYFNIFSEIWSKLPSSNSRAVKCEEFLHLHY